MAAISITGKIVGKPNSPAVTLKEVKTANGDVLTIANFSVLDRDRVYFKNKEDNPGQFFNVEVIGRDAVYAAENYALGMYVTVYGQPVWRQYNGQKYMDIKNSRSYITGDRKTSDESEMF